MTGFTWTSFGANTEAVIAAPIEGWGVDETSEDRPMRIIGQSRMHHREMEILRSVRAVNYRNRPLHSVRFTSVEVIRFSPCTLT
jgi:hypothetical protein